VNILMIGDIVGRDGREAVINWLPTYREENNIDFCIANAENSAGGKGTTAKIVRSLLDAGVDVITLGNHAWEQKAWIQEADDFPEVIRPWNGSPAWPGYGYYCQSSKFGNILVINLLGQVFMQGVDNPFYFMDNCFQPLVEQTKAKIIVIDFHAEATAEKCAFAWFMAGKVTAVCGTHTHVQTADERILDSGTAYITDLGMTGSMDGVIGMDREKSVQRFYTHLPTPFQLQRGNVNIQGALIKVDTSCGQARSIERINIKIED
jgi:metallophosphoesterase (TIGR00282 family)